MGQKQVFIFSVLFIIIAGCKKTNPLIWSIVLLPEVYDSPIVESKDVLERAYQMATMEWAPLKPVPKNGGGFYKPGMTVKGAPYSSVKEINTFLFQDVSYHTFMTALHNPNSVLYTENISKEPYHGENCATYYGSICSSSVMWALGVSIPYSTGLIVNLPFMRRIEQPNIDSLKVCDVLWKKGHVQMVFDIEYRADSLYLVSLFEQSDNSAHISTYNKKDFLKLMKSGPYEAYRYKNIKYTDLPEAFCSFPSVVYNDDLCPTKGDRSVYRTDEDIFIDIFSRDYDQIVLMKDGAIVSSDKCEQGKFCYQNLSPGTYFAYLQSGERMTDSISFEVVEVSVSYTLNDTGRELVIHFLSSATADYAVLCRQNGVSLFYPISESDLNNGFIVVPEWDDDEYFCKVVFKGEYGSVINTPIRVK